MKIWVDADACPRAIKEILYRASQRHQMPMTLVANTPLFIPYSPFITTLVVPKGTDVADDEIVRQVEAGDLVITADIPLAAEVVAKQAFALNPRGMLYTKDNMHGILSYRNLMEEVRGVNETMGGPAEFSHKDRQAFANQLDRLLRRRFSSP